jgi:hypothetical protein
VGVLDFNVSPQCRPRNHLHYFILSLSLSHYSIKIQTSLTFHKAQIHNVLSRIQSAWPNMSIGLQTSLTVSSKSLCITALLLPQTRTRRPNWCSERAKGLGRRFGVGQRAGGSTKVSSFPPSAALEHLPRSTHFDLSCLLHFDYCALIGRGRPTKRALS